MPKPVITFVFKVLRYGLLRYMTHAQTCDNVRVESATLWTASVLEAMQFYRSKRMGPIGSSLRPLEI